jgi:hypothetical protein
MVDRAESEKEPVLKYATRLESGDHHNPVTGVSKEKNFLLPSPEG